MINSKDILQTNTLVRTTFALPLTRLGSNLELTTVSHQLVKPVLQKNDLIPINPASTLPTIPLFTLEPSLFLPRQARIKTEQRTPLGSQSRDSTVQPERITSPKRAKANGELKTAAIIRPAHKETSLQVEGARSVAHWVANQASSAIDPDKFCLPYAIAGTLVAPFFAPFLDFPRGFQANATCLKPHSLVFANPFHRPIASLHQKQRVSSFKGYHHIKAVTKRQYTGKLVSIASHGMGITTLTPKHPVLVVLEKTIKWKKAQDVTSRDFLLYPLFSLLQTGKETLLPSFEKWRERFVLLPITRLENSSYSGPVYNLAVEESNHFVTSNAIVGTSCTIN